MDVLKAYLEDYNKFFIESEGGFSDEQTSTKTRMKILPGLTIKA